MRSVSCIDKSLREDTACTNRSDIQSCKSWEIHVPNFFKKMVHAVFGENSLMKCVKSLQCLSSGKAGCVESQINGLRIKTA